MRFRVQLFLYTIDSLMAHDLGRMALLGLLSRNNLDPKTIDRIIMGTVIQGNKQCHRCYFKFN